MMVHLMNMLKLFNQCFHLNMRMLLLFILPNAKSEEDWGRGK